MREIIAGLRKHQAAKRIALPTRPEVAFHLEYQRSVEFSELDGLISPEAQYL